MRNSYTGQQSPKNIWETSGDQAKLGIVPGKRPVKQNVVAFMFLCILLLHQQCHLVFKIELGLIFPTKTT